ncbi:single-stranded DNA-binding protein [Candidatus Dojkabacteria bacterium]|nr:single-stranded DNA-binding protein [Candidatus Dojkabacteria bacterium]
MTTARSLNKVMIIGNLTRPPVLKKTTNGAVVGTFGVATNTTWKDSDGNPKERAEFHNIVSWNKLAEICAQILNTSMLVYLEGELRTRVWEDNGKKRYRTDIKINDMKLLDSKDKQGIGIDEAFKLGEEDTDEDDEPVDEDEEEEVSSSVKEEADELF